MTTTDTSATPPPLAPTPNLHWFKWIIARNPLYILSAPSLLYGVYRLSIDPNVFRAELSQLVFNFGSLQVYELLLVITAVFLARRRIWYDSALLVCLENAFVFVPFILISQALLIGNRMAAALCVVATVLVLLRFGWLRWRIKPINVPVRLLWLGGVLLAINVGLPILIRALHDDTNMLVWDGLRAEVAFYAWMFGAPGLVLLANLLPRTRHCSESFLRQRRFPLVSYGVWMLATAVHLYCIGYVYEMKISMAFLAPLLWTAAWTLWNRSADCFEGPVPAAVRNALLFPALLTTFVAALSGNWTVFFALSMLNVVLYGSLLLRARDARAFHLLLFSAAMALGSVPGEILHHLSLDISRLQCFAGSLSGYILLRVLMSSNPKAGLLGAFVAGIGVLQLLDPSAFRAHIAAQVGFVFLLAHSLRWTDHEHAGAAALRWMTAIAWAAHSAVWLARDGDTAFWATTAFACVMLVVYFVVRWIFGVWGARAVPYAAALILCITPALKIEALLRSAPVGLLAMAGGFLLFAGGTVLAVTKHRWLKEHINLIGVSRE